MTGDTSPKPHDDTLHLLIAIDNTDTAETILRCGVAVATCLGMSTQAVHVTEGGSVARAQQAADHVGIPLDVRPGHPHTVLLHEAVRPGVAGMVLGIREHTDDPRLSGHLARQLLEEANRPVIAVPPDTPVGDDHDVTRALLPLDGTQATANRAGPVARVLHDHGVQIVTAHVFDLGNIPAVSDQPQYELDTWAHEFLARQGRPGDHLLLRSGDPDTHILTIAKEEDVDLIVLAWSRDLSPGHALVVRRLLQQATVPLLAVPLPAADNRGAVSLSPAPSL